MKQIVCLSSEPWQAAPTRTQHLMTRLRDAEVLFFEPPGSGSSRECRRVRPGLTVYSLPPILEVDEKYSYLFRRGLRRLTRFIEDKLERHRFRDIVLWTTGPKQAHLADTIPYRGLVYDCDREWQGLPVRWESDLAMEADVIFAASPMLADRLSPCNDNIAIVPNGSNFPMFSRRAEEVPPELRQVEVPLFGFVGNLRRDTDLTPVWLAARQRPDWAFAFVGNADKDVPLLDELRALPNVALLGWRPPVELPDYLARFDVCLDLFRLRDVGADIIPQRLYEYLSSGRPIVSMLWEDQVEPFPDVIYGAHTSAEFLRFCQDALAEGDQWARRRRQEYGRAAAWSERAAEVARILSSIGLY